MLWSRRGNGTGSLWNLPGGWAPCTNDAYGRSTWERARLCTRHSRYPLQLAASNGTLQTQARNTRRLRYRSGETPRGSCGIEECCPFCCGRWGLVPQAIRSRREDGNAQLMLETHMVKIFKCAERSRSSMMDVEDEHNHMRAAFGLRYRFGKPATPAAE